MNRIKMGVALVLTGFMVMACGRGFEPMKLKNSSTTAPAANIGNGQPVGGGATPTSPTPTNPFDNSRATTEQLTPELWPQTAGDDPTQTLSDVQQLASIIRGIHVVMAATNDPLASADTRDLTTQIATGCNAGGAIAGESIVARVNFSYLKTSPIKIVLAGNGTNYKLKFACTDSTCQNATLYITSDIPVVDVNGILDTRTVSAAVYMQRMANTGKLVPVPNAVAGQDNRYITVGNFDDFAASCTTSTGGQSLPNNNNNGSNSGTLPSGGAPIPDFNLSI